MASNQSTASPIKLIIKASNQKYDDFTIELAQNEWTIKQLKRHLSENYPSNPDADTVRLIYSGKVLSDHLMLKECIRQNSQSSHVIHIVHSTSVSKTTASPNVTVDEIDLDNELTPGTSSISDLSSNSSSASSTPIATSSHRANNASDTTNNPLNRFDQLQNDLNQLLQQQQQRQQQRQQFQQLSPKDKYAQIHANLVHYYEANGINLQSNAWYSTYVQHLALYNLMHANYLESFGINNYATSQSPLDQNVHQTSTAQSQQQSDTQDNGPDAAAAPAPAPAAAAQPAAAAPPAMGANGQDIGVDREDDWLGILHNICSFLILFSIIYYYSSFERFVVIFSIVFIIILYHNGWLTLQRRRIHPVRRNEAAAAAANNQQPEQQQQPANNGENHDEAEANNTEPTVAAPVNSPNIFRLTLTFIFTFFTSLVPERPQAAAN